MHGDFSNVTFDSARRFSRVLQQQGRVQLDADTNEDGELLLHALRALARDLIGSHGGPGDAFRIGPLTDEDGAPVPRDLRAAPGSYYVDGVRCEAPEALRYTDQSDHPGAPALGTDTTYLVYLDVWERWVSSLQEPRLREVALAGPDTAGRAQVVRQLRVHEIAVDPTSEVVEDLYRELIAELQPADRGLLRAQARFDDDADDPCITPPDAQYRGRENQLYRVEVFTAADPAGQQPATFVWSRDNGSVAFPLLDLEIDADPPRSTLALDAFHPDAQRGLTPGHWVELRDDTDDLDGLALGRARRLHRVSSVDTLESTVVVEGVPDLASRFKPSAHPIVRRWDHDGDPDLDGALRIDEDHGDDRWLELEDGVQVQFLAGQRYRPGDYWLIPARTHIGDVLWPRAADGAAAALPSDGVTHYYAPLAALRVGPGGEIIDVRDLRRAFAALAG